MAKFEYEFQQIGSKKNIVVYKDGNKIFSGKPSVSSSDGVLKDQAISSLKGTYSDISGMSLKKTEKENPPLENNTSGKGENIENTSVISKNARDKIQKTQDATKKELKEADTSSTVSMSSELSKSKLSHLKIPMVGIQKGMSLDNISMKDMVNTNKVNLATDDLSKLKRSDLNIKMLVAMGFGALTIIVIVVLILKRIKAIYKKAKKKRKILIASSTNKPYIKSFDTEPENEDEAADEAELDRLDEELVNQLTRTMESDENTIIDLEMKLSDTNYVTITSPDIISSEQETLDLLKIKLQQEKQELVDFKTTISLKQPTHTAGGDSSNYNDIDQYSKKRETVRKKVNNSPYTIDQRNRTDIMNSSKAVSTKKVSTMYKNNPNYGKYFNTFNI